MLYTYLWEFEVSTDLVADFELHYGKTGTWVRLFRLSPDYIDTLLLKDKTDPGRYLTIDRWRSEEALLAFKSEYYLQYAQLDKHCEGLTLSERSLGEFSELKPS
jgi:hypothetical protein